jgi:hypothetical protein
MNVEIENEATQFHSWEYINRILFAVCMYMTVQNSPYKSSKFDAPLKREVRDLSYVCLFDSLWNKQTMTMWWCTHTTHCILNQQFLLYTV